MHWWMIVLATLGWFVGWVVAATMTEVNYPGMHESAFVAIGIAWPLVLCFIAPWHAFNSIVTWLAQKGLA